DEVHLLAAARYVELNPVRAELVAAAAGYPWSSAAAHLAGQDDELVQAKAMLERVPAWGAFLRSPWPQDAWEVLRKHERTGRPAGSAEFVAGLEAELGRILSPRPAGRRKREEG
ncbi:MAG: transposase, partial [Armatimonadetes bacterium]|nr:transposase [Armatimonadota bacterium]